MSRDSEEIRFDAAGEAALWVRLPETAAPGTAVRWAQSIVGAPWVCEVAPGPGGLLLVPAPTATLRQVKAAVRAAYRSLPPPPPGRVHHIPVCFDPAMAPDLPVLAERANLTVAQVIRRLLSGCYRVDALGFLPGFAYLLGLDPRLWMPRRPETRSRVPAGSVGIGGRYLGLYPVASPGGFHVVGRTDVRLFDPAASPPCRLAPGDGVCLEEVT